MKSETIEISYAEGHLKELISRVVCGVQVVLQEKNKPVARLLPASGRVAGLHAGSSWTCEDFDAPLPETFWTGNK